MLVVRNVRETDLEPLFELIGRSELGLTTLTISRERLRTRIEESVFAFRRTNARPGGQPYVFVMEDLNHGRLVGTSAIYSKVGGFEPFYSYEIKTSVHESKELGIRKEVRVLHLREDHNGPTEIGSLFLAPEYWGHGHGKLLSLSRFLFIAQFPERFEKEIIAELRGVVERGGHSPLWAALGSHFFQIEFPKAETLTSESKKFIADLMPRHPIYIPLLPQQAQDVIGQVHPHTRPARAMLESEGFEFRNFVDIFDGGPAVHAVTSQIRVIRENRLGSVREIVEEVDNGRRMIISNCNLDFRCCLGNVAYDGDQMTIDQVTALRLNLKSRDPLRIVDLKPDPSRNG
jgi:arginine N-succinyltransferase